MNELTKEASKQTILEAIAFLWLARNKPEPKPRKADLKGRFSDFTTTVDAEYDRLPPDYQAHIDRNIPPDWWEPLDKDSKAQKEFMDSLDKLPF